MTDSTPAFEVSSLSVSGFITKCPCIRNITVIPNFEFENHSFIKNSISYIMCDIIMYVPYFNMTLQALLN